VHLVGFHYKKTREASQQNIYFYGLGFSPPTPKDIFVFHTLREISWLAEDLLASQEGLCSMQLVYQNGFQCVTDSSVTNYAFIFCNLSQRRWEAILYFQV